MVVVVGMTVAVTRLCRWMAADVSRWRIVKPGQRSLDRLVVRRHLIDGHAKAWPVREGVSQLLLAIVPFSLEAGTQEQVLEVVDEVCHAFAFVTWLSKLSLTRLMYADLALEFFAGRTVVETAKLADDVLEREA